MSRKYYFIDTENVGNKWLDLPRKIHKKDRIITFYTEHHSKHLEKYMMKQVHNPKILWLECAAGNNALDYQLIGVLSYMITKHPKASFCIYSNDKDYQDAIAFWKSRGIKIKQKGYKIQKKKKSQKTLKQEKRTEEQYVTEIAKSVPVSDLAGWYQALTIVLGQEKGRDWYLKVRNNTDLRTTLSNYCTGDETDRGVNLIVTVLQRYDLDAAQAEDAYKIIQSHNRKNLKAIKEDFDKKFGKNQRYYKVLRPLFRTIKRK